MHWTLNVKCMDKCVYRYCNVIIMDVTSIVRVADTVCSAFESDQKTIYEESIDRRCLYKPYWNSLQYATEGYYYFTMLLLTKAAIIQLKGQNTQQ